MNKIHSLPQPASQPLAAQSITLAEASRPRRLLVLVPESGIDTALTARKVRELANLLDRRIQFVGLCRDAALEPSVRRQLVTLSAIARDDKISTEIRVELGRSWLAAVKSNWQPGDRIVCFTGQRAGLTRRELSELLESTLDATVYVLAGPVQEPKWREGLLSQLVVWSGSIAIIAAFFWLQVKLVQLSQDWGHTWLIYISIFVEVGLIWMWNSMFS